ncbi:MAG: hypothetical protein ACFFDI_31900, partial [Promethearchaeota archaeon]
VSKVNGIFLSGSLANKNQDAYSDIDIGVTTKNSLKDFEKVYASRHQIVRTVKGFSHSLDRGWGNCKMIAALYNSTEYPPIGLEIDIIFSEIHHVKEQMPYAKYKVLFDASGELEELLSNIPQIRPKSDIRSELKQYFSSLPFYVYDAIKAHHRNDMFLCQNLLEEIRKMIYFVIALSNNRYVYGAKRAMQSMTQKEIQIIKDSYKSNELKVLHSLLNLFLKHLKKIRLKFEVENEARTLFKVLSGMTNQIYNI